MSTCSIEMASKWQAALSFKTSAFNLEKKETSTQAFFTTWMALVYFSAHANISQLEISILEPTIDLLPKYQGFMGSIVSCCSRNVFSFQEGNCFNFLYCARIILTHVMPSLLFTIQLFCWEYIETIFPIVLFFMVRRYYGKEILVFDRSGTETFCGKQHWQNYNITMTNLPLINSFQC